MAGQYEEIRISGFFKDNITPTVKKINKQIRLMQDSVLALSSGKGKVKTFAFFREAADSLAYMRDQLDTTTESLRNYRRQAVGVARANSRLARMHSPSGGNAAPPTTGEGGGSRVWMERGKEGLGFAGATAASAIGSTIASAITGAFSWSANLLRNTFQRFVGMFQERIADQMSDIQSAGGIFSIAKSKGLKEFGQTFDDAMNFQKQVNAELAKAAGALPGSTSDYVQTAKGLTDGLMTTIGKDAEKFKQVFGNGSNDVRDAMKNALTDLTTKGVLLGQGQTGGIPLPVLLEQLVASEKISVQSMANQYVALRDNPLLKNALDEAEDALNQTGANTADRLKTVMDVLDKALPAEQINAMKRATSGLNQAVESFFLDPDSGMFGLGRSLNFKVKQYSSTTGLASGAEDAIGLFDLLNDIFANIVTVFAEGMPMLLEMFDPLSKIGKLFENARETSFELYAMFNRSSSFFKGQQEKLGMEAEEYETGSRSFIATLTMFLNKWGMFNDAEANRILQVVKSADKLQAGFKKDVLGVIWNKFINSEPVKEIARAIGSGLAIMINSIRDALFGITAATGTPSGPVGEAIAAFNAAKGGEAFFQIVEKVVEVVFNGLKGLILEIIKRNPMTSAVTGAAAFAFFNPQMITMLLEPLAGVLKTALSQIGSAFLPPLLSIGAKLLPLLTNPVTIAALAVVALALLAKFFKEPIIAFGKHISTKFSEWSETVGGPLGFVLQNLAVVVKHAVDVLSGILRFFSGVFDMVWGFLTGDWQKMKEGIGDIAGGIYDTAISLVEGVFDLFLSPFRMISRRLGLLEKENRREVAKAERSYRSRIASFFSSIFPSKVGGGGSPAANYAPNVAMAPGGNSFNMGGVSAKSARSVTSTGGQTIHIPDAALAGQGSMNLTTMLPLMESLGQKFEPGRKTAGKIQGIQQAWSGRHSRNSKHYAYRGIDIGDATTSPATLTKMFWWLKTNFGATADGGQLEELYYDPVGSMISGGVFKRGSIGGHGHHLHIGWKAGANLPSSLLQAGQAKYMGHVSPLLEEARNMPSGARLAVANTSEAVLNREQMRGLFEGISSGRGGITIGTINVSGSNNPQELARQVVNEIERELVKSKIAAVY